VRGEYDVSRLGAEVHRHTVSTVRSPTIYRNVEWLLDVRAVYGSIRKAENKRETAKEGRRMSRMRRHGGYLWTMLAIAILFGALTGSTVLLILPTLGPRCGTWFRHRGVDDGPT
jgi:hypothetical protein